MVETFIYHEHIGTHKRDTMKQPHNIQTVIGLLETEAILERHLEDTRRDIVRACSDISIRTPGIKTSPDIVYDGVGGAAAPSRKLPDNILIICVVEGGGL